ncbi:MAG: hypothetical protein R6X32_11030 [Chloroflexota bacterium]
MTAQGIVREGGWGLGNKKNGRLGKRPFQYIFVLIRVNFAA